MKKVNRRDLRLPFAVMALIVSVSIYQSGFAQDFEDTIESELDSLSSTGTGEEEFGEERLLREKYEQE